MRAAQQHAQDMRHHQAHEADDPGHGHATGRHAAGAGQQPEACAAHGKAQMRGLFIAKGQLAPARQHHQQPRQQGGQQERTAVPAAALQAAHDPENDAGDGFFVEGFDQGHHGAQKGRHGDTGQDDGLAPKAPLPAAQPERAAQGQQRAQQGVSNPRPGGGDAVFPAELTCVANEDYRRKVAGAKSKRRKPGAYVTAT